MLESIQPAGGGAPTPAPVAAPMARGPFVSAANPLAVEAGIFPFLMLVALSSAVSELHGQSVANRLVLWGFVPLVLSIMLTALVLALPASPEMQPERLAAFDMILGQSPRLMAAGIVAYGTSQFLNVTIFSKLRGREGAGSGTTWLAIRGAIASALSQIVDTLLFVTIAFYGVFPIANLMGGQMLAKVALSITVTRWPRSVRVSAVAMPTTPAPRITPSIP